MLSREAFDQLEFDATVSGDHQAAAERMTWLADQGTQTPGLPRSEAYLRAGEQWLLADDPAGAAHCFRRALDDGGLCSADPRVPLARALYLLGDDDEADRLLGQIASRPPSSPRTCDLAAELLVERSDLPGALAWATAGVQLCLGLAPGPVGRPPASTTSPANGGNQRPVPKLTAAAATDHTELKLLLSLRFRIRNDLGLAEDDYDRLLDELPSGRNGPAEAG